MKEIFSLNHHKYSHSSHWFSLFYPQTGSGNNSHRKIVKYCPATDYKDGEGGHGTAVGSIIAGKRLGVSGYADG